MGRLTKVIILAGVALLAVPAVSQAAERTVVPCWGGYDGEWDWRERIKPARCSFNGGEAHAAQTPLMNMRFRSWGGETACGRGTFFYNQGYRAKVRFCLIDREHYYGNTWSYDHIRVRFGTRSSYIGLNGKREYHKRRASAHTNWTW